MLYVVGEITFLLVLAVLFGLFIGWFLWGQRRPNDTPKTPKRKKADAPERPVLDLNQITKSKVNPPPQPKKTDVGVKGGLWGDS